MLRHSDVPKMMTAGLKTIFFNAAKAYTPMYTELVTEVKSNKKSETYGWLGSTPKLRKWRDERAPKALIENGFTLINEDYEASISVDKNAMEDDEYGQIKVQVGIMGNAAKKWYDEAFTLTVEGGTSNLCYDGQNFFDTDHAEGEEYTTAQSNNLTWTALTVANAKVAYAAMCAFKNDKWQPAGVRPTHIMVPEALRFTAEEIFNPQGTGDTNANTAMKGLCKIIVNPYLTSATTWFLLDLSQPIKPFIYQNRQELNFDTDLTNLFMRRELIYGVDARFAFGYGDRRLAIRCIA